MGVGHHSLWTCAMGPTDKGNGSHGRGSLLPTDMGGGPHGQRWWFPVERLGEAGRLGMRRLREEG